MSKVVKTRGACAAVGSLAGAGAAAKQSCCTATALRCTGAAVRARARASAQVAHLPSFNNRGLVNRTQFVSKRQSDSGSLRKVTVCLM